MVASARAPAATVDRAAGGRARVGARHEVAGAASASAQRVGARRVDRRDPAAQRVSSALEPRGGAHEGADHGRAQAAPTDQMRVALGGHVDGVGQLDDAGRSASVGAERARRRAAA